MSPVPTPTPSSSFTPKPTPQPTPTASFNPASVHIAETSIPVSPLYVAAAPDNAVYFGFGANGTGSNLYRLMGGALTQTSPADPPSGYSAGGGVYGITVTPLNKVFWLSAYFGSSFALYVASECGGAGGTATLCEPTVDEPTSMLVDASGVFWVAGLSFNGGGQVATSTNAGGLFNACIMQILNGPGNAVWGVLADFSTSPAQYSIAEFALNGSSVSIVRNNALPSGDTISSMTVGGDGNFWFADYQRNAIGRMDPRGTLREFPLSSATALAAPWYGQSQIATACDGSVWFSEPGPNKVARIDAAGKINEFAVPTGSALVGPVATPPVTAGRCHPPEVWVGEQNVNKLAAISF